jgi:transposase
MSWFEPAARLAACQYRGLIGCAGQSLKHGRRAMNQDTTYVAFDTSKETLAVAIAESGRRREVRFFGTIASRPEAVRKLVEKLARQHRRLAFCYEAGPTGYGLYRQIRAMGHDCQVVAPSMVPVRPGGHIKTDRRDATTLAALFRAGELTAIWVPDAAHEAMRDLSRGRQAAMEGLRRARQQLLSFLLRHGRAYPTRSHWTRAHRRWLAEQRFEHAAQQIVFEELIQAVEQAQSRRDRLEQQMVALLPSWSLRGVVAALQALRGVASLSAITLMAEIGDFRRFANPRELMAWLGLVPREHSSGATTVRGAITKAGNRRARRVLVEGAWTYRLPARVGLELLRRNRALPETIKAVAWKAQVRLCARYRRLLRAGKPTNVVTVAIARELAAFVWAIATTVMPPFEPTA